MFIIYYNTKILTPSRKTLKRRIKRMRRQTEDFALTGYSS